MFSKKLFIFLLFALFLQVSNCFAQVIRENKGDSFKWVLLTNQNTGEHGAENLQGKTLVPMGKYIIVYHDLNGGYFQLLGNGASAAYSKEGKLLIPFHEDMKPLFVKSNILVFKKMVFMAHVMKMDLK